MANTYNFKTPLLDADDKPVTRDGKELILSNLLSNIIMQSRMSDKTIKFFDWALELKKTGELILDNTDRETLAGFILNHTELTIFEKGRFNQVLIAKEK